jgi:uncharacterized protein YbbK (DUF523 family)
MEKILVSACLLGDKVRYDGGSNPVSFLDELSKHFQIVPFCPEVEGGLSIPREPAEVVSNSVLTKTGKDVTQNYNDGAEKALSLCKFFGIRYAILKDGSPACGPRKIHSGKFDGQLIDGLGVTARLLINNGIKVFAETDNISFLWNRPTEVKRDRPMGGKKKRFEKKPRTLAEANALEAERKAQAANPVPDDNEVGAEESGRGYNADRDPQQRGYQGHGYGHKSFGHGGYGRNNHSHYGHDEHGHGGYGHREGGYHHYDRKPEEGAVPTEGQPSAEGASFEKKPYEGHSSYHKSYGHSGYGHSNYGHDNHGYGHYGHNDHGYKKYDRKPEGEAVPAEGATEGKPYEKKPYEHKSYGHGGYGHSGYGHDNHGHYGHDNHGHSGYGHDNHGHYGHDSHSQGGFKKHYDRKPGFKPGAVKPSDDGKK